MEGGALLIYVSEDQLTQVEYLIGQSIQGNHVLFDSDDIRNVFECGEEVVTEEDSYSVEHHIEKIILQPTLAQKRAYIERLDRRTFQTVIRTYFNIVENRIFEDLETRH